MEIPPVSSSSSTSLSPSPSSSSPGFSDHSLVDFLDQPFLVNVGIVLFLLWLASVFHMSSIWIFALAFLFLFEADRIYVRKVRQQMRSEERRSAHQERPLGDFQTVPWLNQAIEKIWPHFLEKFISQDLLEPMVPWFLDKFKPVTVSKVMLRQLSLGRKPPMFTGVRIVHSNSKDDHLVMELNLEFSAADDMIAVLCAQMRGLGIWTNIHISKLEIGGKVRVGIKVVNGLPYLGRVRLCFMTAPIVQMTVRPLFTHGVNVSDIPLVSGWMERLVADVFEQCLVQPNMLAINVGDLVNQIMTTMPPRTSGREDWFKIQEMEIVATAHIEIVEASGLKPSDLNGLADPFVKGSCGTTKFKTKIVKTTLNPNWSEEFDVPIFNWETLPPLLLHLYDKDTILDDKLGFCSINLMDFRDGQRHDLWIALEDVRTGRLRIVVEIKENGYTETLPLEKVNDNPSEENFPIDEKSEIIKLGIGDNGFISIVSPGERCETNGAPRMKIEKISTYVEEEENKDTKDKSKNRVRFSQSRAMDSETTDEVKETRAVAENDTRLDSEGQQDNVSVTSSTTSESELSVPETPSKRNRAKGKAKEMMKNAGRHLNAAFSRKGSSKFRAAPESVEPLVS